MFAQHPHIFASIPIFKYIMKIKCAKQPLINISMWNIEGLVNSKLSDEHVLDIIAKFQIIGLVETWLEKGNDNISLPGYDLIISNTRKKSQKARRNSGGICIFVKSSLSRGIKKLSNNNPDITWIKLDSTFLILKKIYFWQWCMFHLRVHLVLKLILKWCMPN